METLASMSSAAAASLLLKLPPTGQDRRVVLVGTLAAVVVVAVAAMGRVACARAVRSWAWPAAGAFVGYRCVVLLRSPLLGGGPHVLGVLVSAANLALDTVARHQSAAVSALLGDVVGLLVLYALVSAVGELMSLKYSVVKRRLLDAAYDAVKWLPPVQHEIQKEQRKLEEHFEDHLKKKSRAISLRCDVLPAKGVDRRSVLALMREVTSQEDQVWQAGKVSGAIYHGGAEHIDFLNSAFGCYSVANPLHPDIWPSGMKFEAEIISMTAALVNGTYNPPDAATGGQANPSVCGCTTSGGTESIVLAIKAHRDYYCRRHGIQRPELVACTTAHAAVDKACEMLGITLIKVPMDPDTCRVSLPAVRRAVGANTVMIYSSAPTYPQGAIDPIVELAAVARRHDIGLHVDCCLGGFVLPFMRKLGLPVPPFDFTVPGVTSMSLDTHKYGYALKGTSVLLYAHKELRHAQYFCYADWTGGLYTTPTIAGSRSGGLIAQTWASLVSIGEEGFLRHTKDILETTRAIADGVRGIRGLRLMGSAAAGGAPDAMIVCFASAPLTATVSERPAATAAPSSSSPAEPVTLTVHVNVYAVSDAMSKKGWSLNTLQNPPSVHLCCTLRHVGRAAAFLQDLRACVDEVAASTAATQAALAKGGKRRKDEGNAAIYGMTSSLPPGPVNDLLRTYNDVIFKV